MSPFLIPRVLKQEFPDSDGISLLFDSPHSGVAYPADFGYAIAFDRLRGLEDTYVNEFFDQAPRHGACWLEALFPRSYIDPNRAVTAVDPALLDEPFPGAIPTRDDQLGRSLIWRTVQSGEPIYDRKLTVAEIRNRIGAYYLPYHMAIRSTLLRLHRLFGVVWHVNCHSMPAFSERNSVEGRPGVARADIVLGDGRGGHCEPGLIACAETSLRDSGYSVLRNVPYSGGRLSTIYSQPHLGFHSLQVEINRGCYMDEATRARTEGFAHMQAAMRQLTRDIADYVRESCARRKAACRDGSGQLMPRVD